MALFVHALLILALVLNLDWKTENQAPMQIELWADGTTPTAAPAQPTKSVEKPEPTPPTPEPEPAPVKPPPPPEPPPPPPPTVAEAPKNEVDPEIALEDERKKKAEKERLEKELAEKKAKEDERREKDRIKREKDAAEKKERERLEQIERIEKERKEQEEKEKKAIAEKKEQEEKEKKAIAEKKEKEKKEKEDKEKKLAEEKKAKEAAAKKAAADQAFKDAMRGDVMGAAGMPGGTADRNQTGGGNYSGYGAKIRACVQPGVSFPTPPQSGSNPTVQYRVQLKSDGTVSGVKLLKTSGNSNFDQAVERGISRCTPFPKPDTGSYPSYIDVDYRMY
jgi:colicin import membrane protein